MRKVSCLEIIWSFALGAFLVSVILIVSTSAFASNLDQHFEPIEIFDGQSSIATETTEQPSALGFEFGLGIETRFESAAAGNEAVERTSPRFTLGLVRESMTYQLQYGSLVEDTSSGIFRVESERRELLLLASYASLSDGFWTPVIGGGLGFYQDITTSTLSGLDRVQTESAPRTLAQVFGGVRFRYQKAYLQVQAQLAKRETSRIVEYGFLGFLGMSL